MKHAKTPTRPLLRYHGGKWKLAPWIIAHFPPHRVYCEPYGGGASVLLRKPRSYAEIYNDLDGELVNLFKVVRDNGEFLREKLRLTPFARSEFRLSYEPSELPVEQARRTVVRSLMGFGSNSHAKYTGFRNNSNRSGTTPAADFRNYPEALPGLIERLRGVVIENRHAIELMRQCDAPGSLHYVDPPYPKSTRGPAGDYNHEMTDEEHAELAAVLAGLEGMVVVSGYRCELYDDLYSTWKRVEKAAYADGAKRRVECLWLRGFDLSGWLF